MSIEAILSVVVGSIVALIAAFMSTSAFERLIEQRQKILVRAFAEKEAKEGAKVWEINFAFNQPVGESEPVVCYLEGAGNRFIAHKVDGHPGMQKRLRLNERGQLEFDVAFMMPGQEFRTRCHLARADFVHFSGAKAHRIDFDRHYGWVNVRLRLLLVAKIRVLWMTSSVALIVIIALLRLLFLGVRG